MVKRTSYCRYLHAHIQWSLSSAMRCLWWRGVYKTSRQLKGHFATWHTAIFHLTSPPFSSISPYVHQPRVTSTSLFSFFGMHTFQVSQHINPSHRSVFQHRGTLMLVCGQISLGLRKASLFLLIRLASEEKWGQMWRGNEQWERLSGQLQAEQLLLQ